MSPSCTRRSLPRVQAAPSRSVSARDAQLLMRPLVVAFMLALFLAWPSQIQAQGAVVADSSRGTHTVRPGETLWSLAARYYGDGQKWRELASDNGLADGGARGIAVGQRLRVPATGAVARAALAEAALAEAALAEAALAEAAPPATAVDAPPVSVGRAPTVSVGTAPAAEMVPAAAEVVDASAERTLRIGIARPAAFVAARGNDNITIFLGPARIDADTMTGTIWLSGEESSVAPATRRVGEFQAAPIALAGVQWRVAGRVTARVLASGSRSAREPQRMQAHDLVEVALPAAMDTIPGTQLVTVSMGADLGRGVRLAIPTGVLTLQAPHNGVVVARVSRVYGVIEQGQTVLPLVEAPAAAVAGPVSVVEATVRWIPDASLLPSIQSYLGLAPVEGADVQTGDRFELLSASAGGSRVGEARVVRVTPDGVTAIVTQQDQPAIRIGMRARRIGRAP